MLSQNDCTRPTNSLTECAARQGLDSNCFVPPSSWTKLSDNCTQPQSSSTTKPPKKLDRSTSCNHCQPGHPPSRLTVNQHVTCSVVSPFRPKSHRASFDGLLDFSLKNISTPLMGRDLFAECGPPSSLTVLQEHSPHGRRTWGFPRTADVAADEELVVPRPLLVQTCPALDEGPPSSPLRSNIAFVFRERGTSRRVIPTRQIASGSTVALYGSDNRQQFLSNTCFTKTLDFHSSI